MRVGPLSSVSVLILVACSGDPYPTSPPGSGGASGSSGQTGALGGGSGAPATSGGNPSSGGTSVASGGTSGGFVSAGGATSGGATTTFGGATTTSGGFVSTSGGSTTTSGGATTTSGGSSNGGRGNTGGSSSGGRGATGGSSSGGSNGGTGGGALTYSALCGMCHGEKGEGVPMKGPEIQHPVRDFSTWVVRNGRQGHPSFPNSAMLAYPAGTLPDATLTSFFDALSTPALPKPTTGAALYTDYCGNCHSATGTGGTAGHNAKGQPLSKALQMVRAGHSLGQFSLRNGYMPKWSTAELTDAEVGLIVTYLDSL